MIDIRTLKDTDTDYLLMMMWLNNSEVRAWYGYDNFPQPPTLDDIKRKYRKKILNADNENPNIILIDQSPVGYIQYYETTEYLNEENVYGIDLFIGNDEYRGKGYGKKILNKIASYIFHNKEVNKIIIDPEVKNKRAIKCYLNAGFKKLKEVDGHMIMIMVP